MSDRHEKWVRVEAGTVIPAGQPYRIERKPIELTWNMEQEVTPDRCEDSDWFIDSSWKPPLVLPTEPTWGISVRCDGTPIVDQAHMDGSKNWQISGMLSIPVSEITDFIPLTDEQIKRIESAK